MEDDGIYDGSDGVHSADDGTDAGEEGREGSFELCVDDDHWGDVVVEEDAGKGSLVSASFVVVLGDGVLVGVEDFAGAVVEVCSDNLYVVLEASLRRISLIYSAVEGVDDLWMVLAKGKVVDAVGKV